MLKTYEFIPLQTSAIPTGSSLIFAPHPDDETFGMGGTILKMIENSQTINIVLMTDGSKGGDVNIRKNEFLNATKKLGVDEVYFLNEIDGELEVTTSNINKIINLIENYIPLD